MESEFNIRRIAQIAVTIIFAVVMIGIMFIDAPGIGGVIVTEAKPPILVAVGVLWLIALLSIARKR